MNKRMDGGTAISLEVYTLGYVKTDKFIHFEYNTIVNFLYI